MAGKKVFHPILILSIFILLFATIIKTYSEKPTGKTTRGYRLVVDVKNIKYDTLRDKIENSLTETNIEKLFNSRYQYIRDILPSLIHQETLLCLVEISSNNNSTVTARISLQYSNIRESKKVTLNINSYRGLLPAVTGEIAYLIFKAAQRILNFRLNTRELPPVLESYIESKELNRLLDTLLTINISRDLSVAEAHHPPDNSLQIYSLGVYSNHTAKESSSKLTILTNGGFITIDGDFNLALDSIKNLKIHSKIKTEPFDTVFTNRIGETYLFSSFTNKILKLPDLYTPIQQQDNTLLKVERNNSDIVIPLQGGGIAVIEQSPKNRIVIYTTGLVKTRRNPTTLEKLKALKIYSQFISAAYSNTGYLKSQSLLTPIFYIYDAAEKRIRIINYSGIEIDSIKLFYPTEEISLPDNLVVLSDRSILLSGSGKILKFDKTGLPLWELRDYTIKYKTAFPPYTRFVISEEDETIYIIDNQNNRILKYSYNQEKIAKQSLTHPRRIRYKTETEEIKKNKIASLMEKLGDKLTEELAYENAIRYYTLAADIYKKLRFNNPLKYSYSKAVERTITKRNRLKESLLFMNRLKIKLKNNIIRLSQRENKINIRFSLTNVSEELIRDIKLTINIPGVSRAKSSMMINKLSPGKTITENLNIGIQSYLSLLSQPKSYPLYIAIDYTTEEEQTEKLFDFNLNFLPEGL